MRKIYILLTRSDTVLSRVVHLVTAARYTHVSIAFDEDLQTVYSSSRKNGRTLFPAGPCQEHLEQGYWSEHGHVPCILYELQVSDQVYYAARREVERILHRQEEYHFNILGLILCQMNIPFRRKHHFFCSQFVGAVLGQSGALCLPKDPSVMKPCDYMSMPELACRFQGRLWELLRHRPALAAAGETL